MRLKEGVGVRHNSGTKSGFRAFRLKGRTMSDRFSMPMDRRTLLRASLMLAAAPLAGCVQGEGDTGSTDVGSMEAEADRVLTFGIVTPTCIDPYGICEPGGLQVASQLFDPLMRFDYELGVLSCCAAERVEAADDSRTFTFTLRDACFHDGAPVRAVDFKRAWERVVRPDEDTESLMGPSRAAFLLSLVEGYADFRDGSASELAGVACPDDRTLVVSLAAPYADFPAVVADCRLAPIPAAISDNPAGFARMPIGNGPFMLAEAFGEQAASIELVPFTEHADAPLGVDRVSFALHDRIIDAYRAFEAGDIMVAPCPVENVDANAADWKTTDDERLELTARRRTVLASEPLVSYLVCNTSAKPLDKPGLRYAISMAIDREALVRSVFRDVRMPAGGIVPPMVPGYRDDSWPYADYDPQAASELLDTLYPRDADGERDIQLTLTYCADGGQHNAVEAIVADLAAVGITCTPEAVGFDDLHQRLAEGNFQLGRVDRTIDFMSMDNVLYPLFHSSNIGVSNYARYADDQVDELLEEARSQDRDSERIEILQRVEDIVAGDCPVIPYLFGARAHVGARTVERLPFDATGVARIAKAELAE